jgi:hypothetical protein
MVPDGEAFVIGREATLFAAADYVVAYARLHA